MNDHAAGASPVDRTVRPAAEARWYCLDRDGVAMLCKDEADARAQVIENDDCWPGRAPHRAALLGDVAALESKNAALAREAHAWWTAARDATAAERARCALRVALHSQYPITTDFDRGYDKARKDAAETLRTMGDEAGLELGPNAELTGAPLGATDARQPFARPVE